MTLVGGCIVNVYNLARPALFLIMIAYKANLRGKCQVLIVEALIALGILNYIAITADLDLLNIRAERFDHSLVLSKQSLIQCTLFLLLKVARNLRGCLGLLLLLAIL